MAYILLNSFKVVENQQIRRIYVSGCQHVYKSKYKEPHQYHPHRSISTHTAVQHYTSSNKALCSTLHYKSNFLSISPICSSISLYQDLIIKRQFHSTLYVWKDETGDSKNVNKSVNFEVDESGKIKKDGQKDESLSEVKPSMLARWSTKFQLQRAKAREVGYLVYVWRGLKHGFLHYYNGTKLLFKEARICGPLLTKYLKHGRSSLTRREYRMLTRVMADLIRMIPLIPILLIPVGEVLIPLYIAGGFMPSVFLQKEKKNERDSKKLHKKVEYVTLLNESLKNMPRQKVKGSTDGSTLKDYNDFIDKVRHSKVIPPNEEILKYSRYFEDELTLDDLNTLQLQGLCKLLGIGLTGNIPSRIMLRWQIGLKLRELQVDDKIIQKEGIESLNTHELQNANRARGMRAIGVSKERLKLQLEQWLELHLKEKVPSSLLLLSRVIYIDENLSVAQQLSKTISTLPETTVERVKIASMESTGDDVDKTTKLKVLDDEQKAIEDENIKEQVKKEETSKASPEPTPVEEKVIIDTTPITPDIAEPIVTATTEELEKDEVGEREREDVITSTDLSHIEKAIEDMAKHHKEDLEEVQEDMEDYMEECQETVNTEVEETKGATRLKKKVNSMLSKIGTNVERLETERDHLQEKLKAQEDMLEQQKDDTELLDSISDQRSSLISIDDVLVSLQKLQNVSEKERMQKILKVLDTDEDGKIDITDVLKVTEELGRENLKLNKQQVSSLVNLLRKESELEDEERKQEKEEKRIKEENKGK